MPGQEGMFLGMTGGSIFCLRAGLYGQMAYYFAGNNYIYVIIMSWSAPHAYA